MLSRYCTRYLGATASGLRQRGSALPSITRCYGPAGTVILFAGQALHRATHSLFAQRSLVLQTDFLFGPFCLGLLGDFLTFFRGFWLANPRKGCDFSFQKEHPSLGAALPHGFGSERSTANGFLGSFSPCPWCCWVPRLRLTC